MCVAFQVDTHLTILKVIYNAPLVVAEAQTRIVYDGIVCMIATTRVQCPPKVARLVLPRYLVFPSWPRYSAAVIIDVTNPSPLQPLSPPFRNLPDAVVNLAVLIVLSPCSLVNISYLLIVLTKRVISIVSYRNFLRPTRAGVPGERARLGGENF